jgi:hypothetical protein
MTTSGFLNVNMLDVLREPLETWLADRGLVLAHMPGAPEDVFIVVPAPTTGH